ncbi:hypothetical protein CBS101457_000236 [Exobasidium rhododendri]|nr:hypothetical protein CBS101457_000236 [Exobasidium rhododendri]
MDAGDGRDMRSSRHALPRLRTKATKSTRRGATEGHPPSSDDHATGSGWHSARIGPHSGTVAESGWQTARPARSGSGSETSRTRSRRLRQGSESVSPPLPAASDDPDSFLYNMAALDVAGPYTAGSSFNSPSPDTFHYSPIREEEYQEKEQEDALPSLPDSLYYLQDIHQDQLQGQAYDPFTSSSLHGYLPQNSQYEMQQDQYQYPDFSQSQPGSSLSHYGWQYGGFDTTYSAGHTTNLYGSSSSSTHLHHGSGVPPYDAYPYHAATHSSDPQQEFINQSGSADHHDAGQSVPPQQEHDVHDAEEQVMGDGINVPITNLGFLYNDEHELCWAKLDKTLKKLIIAIINRESSFKSETIRQRAASRLTPFLSLYVLSTEKEKIHHVTNVLFPGFLHQQRTKLMWKQKLKEEEQEVLVNELSELANRGVDFIRTFLSRQCIPADVAYDLYHNLGDEGRRNFVTSAGIVVERRQYYRDPRKFLPVIDDNDPAFRPWMAETDELQRNRTLQIVMTIYGDIRVSAAKQILEHPRVKASSVLGLRIIETMQKTRDRDEVKRLIEKVTGYKA